MVGLVFCLGFVGFFVVWFCLGFLTVEETIIQICIKNRKGRLRRVKTVMRVNVKESEGIKGLLRQRESEENKLSGCISPGFFEV